MDRFAIVIFNSNAATDDNFEIFLNGISIGTIDNNGNAITGRIFADPAFSPAFSAANIASPQPNVFQATADLDTSILDDSGTNTLDIRVTQNNGNGNFGTVTIGYWSLNNNGKYVLSQEATHLATVEPGTGNTNPRTYSFFSGSLGSRETYTFKLH